MLDMLKMQIRLTEITFETLSPWEKRSCAYTDDLPLNNYTIKINIDLQLFPRKI